MSDEHEPPVVILGHPGIWGLVAMLASVAAIWALSGWWLHGDQEGRGTFGDMFGAVNALFSGLAFATLIYTVWMQRYELTLQRRELEMTRAELRGQKEQLEAQNATFTLQGFENTFFELVKVQNQIVDSAVLNAGSSGSFQGRRCFLVLGNELVNLLRSDTRGESSSTKIERIYAEFNERHQAITGHYFRHLYHIVKFIKQSPIKDKRRYTTFLRAQLSGPEQILLFYNCLSSQGRERFKPLVEEFSLLKGLQPIQLAASDHIDLYLAEAFAPNQE